MVGLTLALMALALPLDSLGIQPFLCCYGLFALVIASYGSGFPNMRGLFSAGGYFVATCFATKVSENLLRKSFTGEKAAALVTAAQRHSNDAEYIWRVISEANLSWRGETSLLLQTPALIAAAYVLWILDGASKNRGVIMKIVAGTLFVVFALGIYTLPMRAATPLPMQVEIFDPVSVELHQCESRFSRLGKPAQHVVL